MDGAAGHASVGAARGRVARHELCSRGRSVGASYQTAIVVIVRTTDGNGYIAFRDPRVDATEATSVLAPARDGPPLIGSLQRALKNFRILRVASIGCFRLFVRQSRLVSLSGRLFAVVRITKRPIISTLRLSRTTRAHNLGGGPFESTYPQVSEYASPRICYKYFLELNLKY